MTRPVRIGIYAVGGAVLLTLMVLGLIEQVHVDQGLVLIGQALGLTGSAVALSHLTPKASPPPELEPAPLQPAPWLKAGDG